MDYYINLKIEISRTLLSLLFINIIIIPQKLIKTKFYEANKKDLKML